MWNLIKSSNNVLLLSGKLKENSLKVIAIENYSFISEEEIIYNDIETRFQDLNEGIEIDKDTLLNVIMKALNQKDPNDASVKAQKLTQKTKNDSDIKALNISYQIDKEKNQLKLDVSFEVFNISMKWFNLLKKVDKLGELFVQPLVLFMSLSLLQQHKLQDCLREAEKIIEDSKDTKTTKKFKRLTQKCSIKELLDGHEIEDNLGDKCCEVFSKDNCQIMEEVCNKVLVSPFFQSEKVDDKMTKNFVKCSEHAEKSKTATKTSSVTSASKRLINEDTSSSQETELKRRKELEKSMEIEKRKKVKKLRF